MRITLAAPPPPRERINWRNPKWTPAQAARMGRGRGWGGGADGEGARMGRGRGWGRGADAEGRGQG
ncbi:hypothetical protein Ade02nite_95630 [Paractinoplanes deccanensis]|uniref:Uncharacterized protein n=1 Tax=Paractinoplanes deccanensis TaxID=113561 RepID=A0ABQ3YLP2_9ACTN|nr:hypothetical protein Ade02nite_95630 [Actinoplanes deccanensis]